MTAKKKYPESTALVVRQSTALVTTYRQLRRVFRCVGCAQLEDQCVCGTGVFSIGHKLEENRRRRFWEKMWDSLTLLLSDRGRSHLHLVRDDPQDE